MSKTAEEFAEVLCDCAQAEDEVRGRLRWCMAIDGVAMVEQAMAQASSEATCALEKVTLERDLALSAAEILRDKCVEKDARFEEYSLRLAGALIVAEGGAIPDDAEPFIKSCPTIRAVSDLRESVREKDEEIARLRARRVSDLLDLRGQIARKSEEIARLQAKIRKSADASGKALVKANGARISAEKEIARQKTHAQTMEANARDLKARLDRETAGYREIVAKRDAEIERLASSLKITVSDMGAGIERRDAEIERLRKALVASGVHPNTVDAIARSEARDDSDTFCLCRCGPDMHDEFGCLRSDHRETCPLNPENAPQSGATKKGVE